MRHYVMKGLEEILSTWQSIIKSGVTAFGRWKRPYQYAFKDSEVVSPGFEKKISIFTGADYVNLHPTTYVVARSPEGTWQNLKGGYVELHPGRYTYHLVDKRDRSGSLPKIAETTLDGAMVSLVISVMYKVVDPIRVMEIQNPVDALLSGLHSDTKEYIRTHTFDEIVGNSDSNEIDRDRMFRHVRQEQGKHHQISRAFAVGDLMVKDREVDSRFMDIRKNLHIQQGEKDVEAKLLTQNQELEKRVASQEVEINQMKAKAEVSQQEILKKVRMQEIVLDRERQAYQMKQERWSHTIDVLERAFSMPNYIQSTSGLKLIQDIISELKKEASIDFNVELSPDGGHAGVENQSSKGVAGGKPSNLDDLTNTLLSMLDRNKR